MENDVKTEKLQLTHSIETIFDDIKARANALSQENSALTAKTNGLLHLLPKSLGVNSETMYNHMIDLLAHQILFTYEIKF